MTSDDNWRVSGWEIVGQIYGTNSEQFVCRLVKMFIRSVEMQFHSLTGAI